MPSACLGSASRETATFEENSVASHDLSVPEPAEFIGDRAGERAHVLIVQHKVEESVSLL